MKRHITTIILIVTCFYLETLQADPAAPIEIEVSQPSGGTFMVIPRGDEYSNWNETSDGHTVVRKNDTWFYAEKDDAGRLGASNFRVGELSPAVLQAMPLHVRPKQGQKPLLKERVRKIPRNGTGINNEASLSSAMPISHTQNVLTVLVDYSDQTFTYTDGSVRSLVYGVGGSARHFFLENSYNRFTIIAASESYGDNNDGIIHVTRATTHPNQGEDSNVSRAEAREIVSLTDAFVNYAAYDTNADGRVSPDELSILIIVAGYASSFGGVDFALTPNFWPHALPFHSALTLDGVTLRRYTMTGEAHATSLADKHQATIGTMCHELGHLMLGLPDLYDTDGSSEGIGSWGLMGNGGWNQTGNWPGDRPGHMSAWSKVATNFTIPEDIIVSQVNVSIGNADMNENAKRIWIDKYRLGEYFLVENRQTSGYDAGLPGSGLLIWHIDDHQDSNMDESHKWVAMEEADGQMHLDLATNRGDMGDPFPGLSNNTSFNNASTPNSMSISGIATQIGVTNIADSSSTMTADITLQSAGRGGNVSYLGSGSNFNLGYDSTTVWAGIRALNDTAHETFDGVDVHVNDHIAATIDVLYYTSMVGGNPTGLIHTQTGFAAAPGWNRLLFTTPQSFPIGAERGVVLKIVNNSLTYPVSYVPGSVGSGRSYMDSDGTGSFSQLCSSADCGDINLAALLSTLPTDRPTNVSASDGTFPDRVRVTFNTVVGATVYRVFRCLTSGQTCGTPIGFPKTGTFDDTKGVAGSTYFYRVRACNATRCGKFSLTNTGFSNAAPAGPTGINATDGWFSNKVRVTFVTVDGATVYRVFRCTTTAGSSCGIPIGFPKTGTFDDKKGALGVVYYYRVRACNAAGCGPFSLLNAGSRHAKPVRATGVIASDGIYSGRTRVTWKAVPGTTVYRVFRCPTKGPDCGLPIGFPKAAGFNDFKGAAGVVYFYRVRACNKTGDVTICSLFSVQNPGHRGTIPGLRSNSGPREEPGLEIDPGLRANPLLEAPVLREATPIPVLEGIFGRWILILMVFGFGSLVIKRRHVPARE